MRASAALCCANLFALLASGTSTLTASAADSVAGGPAQRIEARSADLLAVGIVQGDRMAIHLSRLRDNAPVRDAVLTVLLRGTVHPTVAEADGGYSLQTRDLALPGAAAVQFQVSQGSSAQEQLDGVLQAGDVDVNHVDKNGARQLYWWVLNFAVCIGFLVLWSRRRKTAGQD